MTPSNTAGLARAVRIEQTDTPVVVVNCRLAALAIMRSLGRHGIPLYGIDADRSAPALRSKYCRGGIVLELDESDPEPYLQGLIGMGRTLGRRSILIPTSDETAQFVADHAGALREHFTFQDNSSQLVRELASKREMFRIATLHDVPTPATLFPTCLADVEQYAHRGVFPVMLKGVYGNRLALRTQKKMAVVQTPEELIASYREMEDPDDPNLMIQEYIPGGDDQVYIFNGYFNRQSDCLIGFTGYKIRQFPVHVGCASLGESRWVEEVAQTTTRFMKAVGYQGILDIGYRLDPRDGLYKVLDINPRIGQAFRLFVARNDHDVAKALYLDLTGQPQPAVERREGRRWLIEDFDLISSSHYYREGTLGLWSWIRSFRGVEEAAWFSWRDPAPFGLMVRTLARRVGGWLRKKSARETHARAAAIKSIAKRVLRIVPLSLRKRAAIALQRQTWIAERRRGWWAVGLIRDLADRDVNAYHEFLWSHHLGYAESYEPASRFGPENLKLSRRMFFTDLRNRLTELGYPPEQIRSVFEVGCSLGYQLRWMETDLFPRATELGGADIDEYAIHTGSQFLRTAGSRVKLQCADMRDLEALLAGKTYDLIVCTGVLMYLKQDAAEQVVRTMLRHTKILALAGLAHPQVDNVALTGSDVRRNDNTFIHNFDRMIAAGGGTVRSRRWEGPRDFDGNTIYFVFATGSGVPVDAARNVSFTDSRIATATAASDAR